MRARKVNKLSIEIYLERQTEKCPQKEENKINLPNSVINN
jgi:hypothetical protein